MSSLYALTVLFAISNGFSNNVVESYNRSIDCMKGSKNLDLTRFTNEEMPKILKYAAQQYDMYGLPSTFHNHKTEG